MGAARMALGKEDAVEGEDVAGGLGGGREGRGEAGNWRERGGVN